MPPSSLRGTDSLTIVRVAAAHDHRDGYATFDLTRRPGLTDAVVAVDALLTGGLVGLPVLAAYAGEHAGRPGTRQTTRVLELAVPGAESPMETRLGCCSCLPGCRCRPRLLGWTVLRFTAGDVLRNPRRVVEQVRRALRPDLLGH
jgi:hypothetical protein